MKWLLATILVTKMIWTAIWSVIRALTNTVGGEYECIHDYRVTNTNANYS